MPESPTDPSTNQTLAAEIDRLRGELAAMTLALGLLVALLDRLTGNAFDLVRAQVDRLLPINDRRREGISRFLEHLAEYFPQDGSDISPTVIDTGQDHPPRGLERVACPGRRFVSDSDASLVWLFGPTVA